MNKVDIIEFSKKDTQSITSDWIQLQTNIDGVIVKELKNVAKETGYLSEIFRDDWDLANQDVRQIFQVTLFEKSISGWHTHKITTDRIYINNGLVKIVLYDSRVDSPTYGMVNEFRFGTLRPALVIIPPNVWHAVQNLYDGTSQLINIVDHAYQYTDPDHYRLPLNTDLIPYKF
ncbi:dTDP-4-dehydrorhamnose 3,5-epimerase family protein [Candidatus Kapaibacterium sp.]